MIFFLGFRSFFFNLANKAQILLDSHQYGQAQNNILPTDGLTYIQKAYKAIEMPCNPSDLKKKRLRSRHIGVSSPWTRFLMNMPLGAQHGDVVVEGEGDRKEREIETDGTETETET